MVMKSVGFRLGTEGKSSVVNDFADVGKAGKAAFGDVAESAEASAARAAAAAEELTERQQRAYSKVQAAAANSGLQTPMPQPYATPRAANDDIVAVKMAAALKGEIDPLWAATQRLNRELERLTQIERLGVLSATELAQAQGLARRRFDETALAIERDAVAHAKGSSSAGAHRQAMQGLSYQVQDTFTQISMGTNVLQVLAIQGGQAAGQMTELEGKAGAVARFMVGPWGLAFTGGLLVVGALTKGIMDNGSALDDAIDKLKADAAQSDITDRAKAHFAMTLGGVTAALDEVEAALEREKTASRSAAEQASDHARTELIRANRIRETTKALLEAAIAQERVDSMRAQAPGERGELGSLANVESGNRVAALEAQLADTKAAIDRAQALVDRADVGLADEASKASREDLIKRTYDGPNGIIAKARERLLSERATVVEMERQLRALRDQRDAKIKTAQDAARSERTAANDNRQTGRQIGLSEAETIVRNIGGVITSSTRTFDEQRVLYERYFAGKGPLAAKPGTSDHEDSRALDIRKTAGMSLAKIRAAFTAEGVAIKQLIDEGTHFHVAWGKGARSITDETKALENKLAALQGRFDPLAAAAREYNQALADIKAQKLDPATAQRYADAAKVAFEKAKDAVTTARAAAFTLPSVEGYRPDQAIEDKRIADQDEADKRRADFVRALLRDQAEANELADRDLQLAGASDDVRDREIGKLRLIHQLRREGVDIESDDGRQILASAAALDEKAARLKVQAAGWRELRGFGEQFAETVLSPNTWSSWGNAGKTILNELKAEFIKLALLNPLKNLINGNNDAPTLGSLIGSLTKVSGAASGAASPGRNAVGTEFWSGGMTWVAENGPELINLPAGAKVTPAAQTRQLLAANDAGTRGEKHFHFDLRGAVVTADLLEQMNALASDATVAGAVGGSQLAKADSMASNKRKLGRRW